MIKIAYCTLVQKQSHQLWKIKYCPYCGRVHYHGAGDKGDDPMSYLGHRAGHCGPNHQPNEGYILKRG